MAKECLYPEVSGTDVCPVENEYAVYLCCKGCSLKSPVLLEMSKVTDLNLYLDTVPESKMDPRKAAVIEALRERGVGMEPEDDNYPYDLVDKPNLRRMFRKRK